MHRDAHAIGQELPNIDRISHHLHSCHQAFRREQGTRGFKLPGGEPIADYGVERDIERSDAVEKCFLGRHEQSQVRFIINDLDISRHLFSGFRPLQLHIILICNQVRGDQDAAFR